MELSEILAKQQKELPQGQTLSLDANNLCQMTVGEKHLVTLERSPLENCFYLYAPVDRIPHGAKKEVLSRLLSGNLFGRETGRATLAIDQDSDVIVLSERFDEEGLSYQSFSERLQAFVGYLEYWKKVISEENFLLPTNYSLNEHLSGLVDEKALLNFYP